MEDWRASSIFHICMKKMCPLTFTFLVSKIANKKNKSVNYDIFLLIGKPKKWVLLLMAGPLRPNPPHPLKLNGR